MAEMTQAEIEAKITAIDAQIATVTAALAGGAAGAPFTSYSIGNLSVSGNQQLEQLIEARKMYQELLQTTPSEATDVTTYDVQVDGDDDTELQGDE